MSDSKTKALAQFIVAQTSSFAIGTTLQVNWRPTDAPDRCTTLLETGGSTITDLPDREDKLIQLLSRALASDDARDDAYELFDALHGVSGFDLPEVVVGDKYRLQVSEATSPPQYLGINAKKYHEYSTNYILKIRDRD